MCTASSIFPITDERGKVYGISILARDVTAERTMERESARLERLSVMGQLAAGIGHELRNPLTTVRGFLQFFAGNRDMAAIHPQLAIMLADLESAHAIVSQFLSLARDSVGETRCADLNQVVQGVLPMLRADALIRACCVTAHLRPVPRQRLVEGEIAQLILNLARNGLQAMAEGGVLTISTEECDGAVLLKVSDTGHGIAKGVAEKMWTPFFTTRDGTVGLGLAVCECIAKRQGATITFVTSEQGSTFTVAFQRGDRAC
ncbi:MAG: Sensor protein ZraS [Firmicutes bacterium]|nr:Sensor protein ZraS [candidate division NPL-UPA2 bacterium]